MELNTTEVRAIVEEVVTRLLSEGRSPGRTEIAVKADYSNVPRRSGSKAAPHGRGVFSTVDDAVEAAAGAFAAFGKRSLDTRRNIVQQMRIAGAVHAEELAKMAVEETGLGRVEDKVKKNRLAVEKTPGVEDLLSTARSGDRGLTLEEMAPYGVIGSITPSTNPPSTIINNSIGMVAAGNAVVFNPHPSAKRVSLRAMELMNEAIEKAGGPPNLLTAVQEPTIETSNAVMKHGGIRILVVTGGPGVVQAAMASGKKSIAAGPGNPPAVVDETADLTKAARDIVNGASFDNNVMCQAEKEVFAVDKIASDLIDEMQRHGAHLLTREQKNRLVEQIFQCEGGVGCANPILNRKFVGKNAAVLAKAIGLNVPDATRLLICEVDPDDVLVMHEQLMPFLPVARVHDVREGIERAVKAEGGRGHTATMHSKNVEHLSTMAHRVNTAIFVKNGPTYAGLGFGGEGHTTLTIGTTTGEGITSARHFTRVRRCTLVDYFRII